MVQCRGCRVPDTIFDFESPEEQAESIRALITSPAWTGFFIPELERARMVAMDMLLTPGPVRTPEIPDDYLRAKVRLIDWFLRLGPAEVMAWDQEQDAHEAENAYHEQVVERANVGRIGPLSSN